MTADPSCWYVIYTRPRHEKKVAAGLASLEIEHFLPIVNGFRISGSKKCKVSLPLFPSYLFARPGSVQCYLDSLAVPGVLHYLRTEKQITPVSGRVIEELKAIAGRDDSDMTVNSLHFPPGESITISTGPFTGMDCEVVRYLGRHKILVRVPLLRRNILIDTAETCFLSAGTSGAAMAVAS